MLNFEQEVNLLLHKYKLNVEYEKEEDGTIIAFFKEMDLISVGKNKNEALKALKNDLKEYAEHYFADFDRYYNAPNRRDHFPYLLKVMLNKKDNLDL